MRRGILALIVVTVGAAVFAERQPYSRYETIVQRQMFGQPPEGFDPTRPPSEVARSDAKAEINLTREQAKLKSAVRFSVINVTPEGETAVGFTDNSTPKEPRHYYLRVGEERDGWRVKEADAAQKTMTIVKGEVEVSLTLGGDSARMPNATGRAGAANSDTASRSGRRLGSMLGAGSANMTTAQVQEQMEMANSLRERKRRREEAARRQREMSDAERAEREAREKAELAAREAKEAEEKAVRDAERENSKRELAELKKSLERMREKQAAQEEAEAAAQQKTLEADGDESVDNGEAE